MQGYHRAYECKHTMNVSLHAAMHERSYSAAQMRFPTALVRPDRVGEWCLAAHHATLLDGEMIVDKDDTNKRTRRYLAYDCMAVNGKSLVELPWKVLHLLPPAAPYLCFHWPR